MDTKGKEYTKLRFAACLVKIINANKIQAEKNKENNKEDINLISSLRKLAASSTVDFATIQRIATGKKNAAWSTAVLIVEGLNMSVAEWGDHYDRITDREISTYKAILQSSKKERLSKGKLQKPK